MTAPSDAAAQVPASGLDHLYRTVVEHATEGIAVIQDGRFVFANASVASIGGMTADELVGREIAAVFHPDDLPEAIARQSARMRGEGTEYQSELRVLRRDGGVRWIRVFVTGCEWQGRPASLGLVTDVTARRAAEEALRRSEQQHRAVVENAGEGISVIQERRLVFANPRMATITGYGVDELLAMPTAEFLVHPDDRAQAARVHGGGARSVPREVQSELRLLHKTGRVVWVADSAVAIEWKGRPATLSFTSDISGRKELEARLYSSLAERETILQSALVGISLAVDRRHLWVNRRLEELLGYGPGELVGASSRIHFEHEAAWAAFGAEAYPQLAQGRPYHGELRMRRKDGSLVWVEVFGAAIDTRDLSQGTIWTYLDTSERRRAEEQTRAALAQQRQLNDLKARFVSMASHEFRTPLAAIFSSAELLRRYADRLPETEKLELYDSIAAGVRRMTQLLDDVLLFGRADAGRLEFEPRPLDLRALCEELVEEQRRALQGHAGGRHVLVLDWLAATHAADGDEKLLRHILGNLLSNAVKYSPDGGRIALEVTHTGDAWTLVVSDPGIGIPPQDLPNLFGVFHRGSNVGTLAGTGLGLAIVRLAVERHGGRIEVDSTPGRGSRFTVTLPATPG